jgi:hypothetical protein
MALLGKEAQAAIHPKYWPYCEETSNAVKTYQIGAAQGSDASAFYGQLAGTFGAFNTTASKTADTYYTFLDVTGSHGAMGSILFSKCSSAAAGTGFHTIKLTTDGVVEEFRTISATLSDNYRQFIGFAMEYAEAGADSYSGWGVNLHRFSKFNTGIDSYDYGATMRSVQDSIREGIPVHQFNESLKVEVKSSLAGHASTYECYGTVLYTSAPNL